MGTIRETYPDTDILPSVGNNDVYVHNNVPCYNDTSEWYYSELFNAWFGDGKNYSKNFNFSDVKNTFM